MVAMEGCGYATNGGVNGTPINRGATNVKIFVTSKTATTKSTGICDYTNTGINYPHTLIQVATNN